MGKCNYTYKGKEYNSLAEISKVLERQEVLTKPLQETFVVKGTEQELDAQEVSIYAQAEIDYGTDEVVNIVREKGKLKVFLDGKAINDLISGEKLVELENGEKVSYNIEELVNKEKQGKKIPFIKYWKEHKRLYYNDKARKVVLEQIKNEKKKEVKSLKSRLEGFATKLGIKITSLNSYLEEKRIRDGVDEIDVEGLADMLEKTIAVSNTEDVNVLTEEVSHFAIEYNTDQEIVSKMIAKIHETTYYKEFHSQYTEKYSNRGLNKEQVERKVRKEILGKILADKIKDNFKMEDVNSTEIGIFTQLKKLWQNFKNLFKKTEQNKKFFTEFGKVLDEISQNVINEDTNQIFITDSKEIYFSLTPQQQSIHDTLEKTIDFLQKQYKTSFNASKSKDIQQMRDDLAKNKFKQVLNMNLGLFKKDSEFLFNVVNNSTAEELNKLVDKGDIEGLNILNYLNTFPKYIKLMQSEINDSIEDEVDRKHLLDITYDLTSQFNKTESRIRLLSEKSLLKSTLDMYRDSGMDEKGLTEVEEQIKTKNYKDFGIVQEFLGLISKTNNPFLKLAYSLIDSATQETNKKVLEVSEKVRDLQRRYNISDKLSQKLLSGLDMINPWKLTEVEKFIKTKKISVEEKYLKLIEEEEDFAKKRELQDKLDAELYEIDLKYLESYLTEDERRKILTYNIDNKTKYYSRITRSIIQQRAFAKAKILYNEAYKDVQGNLDFEMISNMDLRVLEEVDRIFNKEVSAYNDDGSLKEGISKRVSEELKIYLESIGSSFEADSQQDLSKFETDRLKAKNKGDDYYKKWLSVNATIGYPNAETETQKVVDVERTLRNFSGGDKVKLFAIIDSLAINLNHTKQEIADFIDNKNESQLAKIFLQIQEGLLDKRKQLVKPYRIKGNYSEIQGNLISENSDLTNTLHDIRSQLSQFSVKYEGETKINFKGNKAFRQRQLETANNIEARRKLNLEAEVENGIPRAYHYRTFEVVGKRKSYQPSVSWIVSQETSSNTKKVNTNYNTNLAGKAIQPKINEPELQQFKNKEFYSTFGINEVSDFWGEKGANKNKGLYELRELYLKEKEIVDGKMNNRNSYFKLPYILAEFRDIKGSDNIKGVFKGVVERSFLVNDQDDEIRDSNKKFIPKRYLQPEDADASKLTTDVSQMFQTYIEKGYDYTHKGEILSKILQIEHQVKNATYDNDINAGATSRTYKQLDSLISRMVYGQHVKELKVIGKGKQKLSISKTLKTVYTALSNGNLMFNPIIPLVGAVSATTMLNVEALAQNQISKEDLYFAKLKVVALAGGLAKEAGSINSTSELKQMFEMFSVNTENKELSDGIFKGKTHRLMTDIGYAPYKAMGSLTGGFAMVSILSGYRLVNGRFININQFKTTNKELSRKEIQEKWGTYKDVSVYNFLKKGEHTMSFDRDKLERGGFDVSEKSLSDLRTRISSVANNFHAKVEGMSTQIDRAVILSHPIGMFAGQHRSWFFNAISNRFMSKNWNILEGRYEEGNYNTAWRLGYQGTIDFFGGKIKASDVFNTIGSLISIGMYSKGFENLEEFEEANLKRTVLDIYAYAGLFFLMVLANLKADDDDDKYSHFMAYIATRALIEQGSITAPFGITESISMIKQPVAGGRNLEMVVDAMSDLVFFKMAQEVDRGKYKGQSKFVKHIVQQTWLRSLYTPLSKDGYKKSNLYMRSNTIGLNKFGYEFIKESMKKD